KNTSMAELADTLERMATAYIDHPVVDATALEGGFDFTIGLDSESAVAARTAARRWAGRPGGAGFRPEWDYGFRSDGTRTGTAAGEAEADDSRDCGGSR